MKQTLQFKNINKKTGKEVVAGRMEISNKSGDSADLFFYGDIVNSSWMSEWEEEDKCPQDVADFLNNLDGVKNINMFINSGGGSVFGGLAIYHQLKRHPAYITARVDGLAGSIASVILFSADKVIIPVTSQLMIHKPWTMAWGNAHDLRKQAEVLDKIEETLINVYADNLKNADDINVIRDMVDKETWMNGQEASEYFNIEVEEDFEAVACTSQFFDMYKNIPNNKLLKNNKIKDTDINDIDSEILRRKIELRLQLLS